MMIINNENSALQVNVAKLKNALLAANASFLLRCILFITAICFSASSAAVEDVELDSRLQNHVVSLESLISTAGLEIGDIQNRVVVVTFFASWCPPCRDEFKALNDLKNQLRDGLFTVVAINVFEEYDDNDAVRMERFLNDSQPEFHVLKGTEETLALFGGINRIPTLLAFDKGGNQAFNFIHARGAKKQSLESQELLHAIKPLLER